MELSHRCIVHLARMIQTYSLAPWCWENVVISNQLHTQTLLLTTIAPVGRDLDIGQELMTSLCLALMILITVGRWSRRTAWNLVTATIVQTTWLASIATGALLTVETLCIVRVLNITDARHVLVTIIVILAFVRVLTQVRVHVTDLTRLAVEGGIVTSRTTAQPLAAPAVETVVMGLITHLIKSLAVLMIRADHLLALMSIHVALVISRAVTVLIFS